MLKNYKVYLLILPTLLISFMALFLLSAGISKVSAEADPKVWVCKYSGEPGVNEFLKPGKQPIVVSSNATVGEYFNDAHGRSYVLDIQTDENTGQGNTYIGELTCPGGVNPTPELKDLNLTFMQPCEPLEGHPEQAEWRIRNPNNFYVEYTVLKAGTGQIASGEAPSGDSFFYTPWGSQTLILKWGENGSKTKAGGDSYNGTMCEIPEPEPYFNLAVCYEGEIGDQATEARFGYYAKDMPNDAVVNRNTVTNGGALPEGIPLGENSKRIWSTNTYSLNSNNYVWTVKIEDKQKTSTIDKLGGKFSVVTENNQCPQETKPEPSWSLDKTVVESCIKGEDEKMYAKAVYNIHLENIGDGKGYVSQVIDELDSKVEQAYINEISHDGHYSSGKIYWVSGDKGWFDPGEDIVFTYEIYIPESAYGTYINTAKAYARVPSDNCVDTISTVECIPPETVVAMDTVEIDLNCEIEEPTYCEVVEEIYGEWSEWKVDPEDDTREYRERTITEVDAEDNTYFCGEEVEIEYRDIEDEGDVLGEDDVRDTGEVLGTSIVYAQTAGGDRNYLIHLIQYFLTILTGFSFIYLGKKKFEI